MPQRPAPREVAAIGMPSSSRKPTWTARTIWLGRSMTWAAVATWNAEKATAIQNSIRPSCPGGKRSKGSTSSAAGASLIRRDRAPG